MFKGLKNMFKNPIVEEIKANGPSKTIEIGLPVVINVEYYCATCHWHVFKRNDGSWFCDICKEVVTSIYVGPQTDEQTRQAQWSWRRMRDEEERVRRAEGNLSFSRMSDTHIEVTTGAPCPGLRLFQRWFKEPITSPHQITVTVSLKSEGAVFVQDTPLSRIQTLMPGNILQWVSPCPQDIVLRTSNGGTAFTVQYEPAVLMEFSS